MTTGSFPTLKSSAFEVPNGLLQTVAMWAGRKGSLADTLCQEEVRIKAEVRSCWALLICR